ncbi:tannase/feruloyl esterase family alpha/beta hydrolase [Yangia mangrovi]|uniref:Tannase/feruloyl esterase family alpha/beta hydrolase n=1 Tax=Alloyangia mangrovi TaxID=1779329 RepID=A0ABT2KSH8_9RHOB|nr:tannase/feruloyl esterase family alpha/beta hydrolase [Alloyangia mangrovi]MCT4373250.1 tannase/feruloyl esterase family alpha/beta hydrolase [Alloyangia mangrovi]
MALITAATALASAASAEMTEDTCSALAEFAYPDLRIEVAEFLSGATIDETALPNHCRVEGYLEERVGSDGKRYATGFELRMPVAWNERFYFQGGGGTDGSIRPAVGVNTIGHPPALTLGFAVVSTDAGHNLGDRADTSFGLEPKARVDWGYNAIDLTATVSKALLQAAYGTWPRYSYFVGNSNGGRQGLIFALRHPNQFDGILAQNPIRQQTRGHVAGAWSVRVLAERAPTDAAGKPIFTQFLDDADFALLTRELTAQCDELDGLKDGVVDSARLCSPDFSALECRDGATEECLSRDQIDAFTLIHEGPVNSAGEELYVPFAYDAGSDFMGWHIGDADAFPNNGRKARNTSMHNVFRDPPDPDFDVYGFDFDTDPVSMNAAAQFTDAASADLDAFKGAGGRLIVVHSMGDSGISAVDTTRWFETLQNRYGAETGSFARLFLLTGVRHDRTGSGPHVFPGLEMLMAWVEDGSAPDHRSVSGGTPSRERPLCAYPRYVTWEPATESWGCQE